MNILDIRKKKERKQQELKSIKKDYETVTRRQWILFSLFNISLLVVIIALLIR